MTALRLGLHRIELYVLRMTSSAFVMVLVTLTGVIWVTQALREFDLLTSKGQTVIVFFVVTGLSLPLLFLVIAPIALFLAVIFTYNRLGSDSELIVMTSAGMSPTHVVRPIVLLACAVAVVVGAMSIHLAPASMRLLRQEITKIRADVVANIVQPGRFTSVEKNLTFHIRARQANGELRGLLVADRRDPNQEMIYLAERGQIIDSGDGMFLVLQDGSLQRRTKKDQDTSIVFFERYAFDLSQFSGEPAAIHYKPRERTLSDLMSPDPADPYFQMQPGRFRSEIHERLTAPLYPLAFVMCAFAFLGQARSTREGRSAAAVAAVAATGVLRLLGFAVTGLTVRSAAFVPLMYLLPISAIALGYLAGSGRLEVAGASALDRIGSAVSSQLGRLIRPMRA
ncbi:LPS export ABC transporter permease LptF [Blastochloris tepida]|uniref:LPS export ABC transporter permease LptF n=1 Tax=Blastochloris tepida TaxID=2233851 RepID=A0A348FWP3_9HYPH|nr:LPS export ABC transporter permease LptF [Blastochloris tepida]BBF91726.1 LPS export ABC transporter permease LptF [Blastochloris tepida]